MASTIPDERSFYSALLVGMPLAMAVAFLVLLAGVSAPYGRYSSKAWGPGVEAKLAWTIQEIPTLVVLIACYVTGVSAAKQCSVNLVLAGLFVVHYTYRALIFPMLIRGGKPTPLTTLAMAFVFCTWSGYMQGRHLFTFHVYPVTWFQDPRFLVGTVLFIAGLVMNITSDHILRNLREPGESGYKIPHGGIFEYVSGANFLGEIIEWLGFACACWSWPALALAVSTIFNLAPRAGHHHAWYRAKFEDYPPERKALIPACKQFVAWRQTHEEATREDAEENFAEIEN